MRLLPSLTLTLAAMVGFAAAANAADQPRIQLSDEKLPLYELRPLDRRVFILTLDGKWGQPATAGTTYYVNLLFPNGQSSTHRVLDDEVFRQGEVRAVIQDYLLKRSGIADGGKFAVVVSAGKPATSTGAREVISNVLEVSWPMDRPVVQKAPRTRYTLPEPIDPFPPAPNELPPRGPGPKRGPVDPGAEPIPLPKPAVG